MTPLDELLDELREEARRAESQDRLREAIDLVDKIQQYHADNSVNTSVGPIEKQLSALLLELIGEGIIEEPQKMKASVEKLGEEFPSLRAALAHIPPKSRNTPSNDTHPEDVDKDAQSKVSIVIPPQTSNILEFIPGQDDRGRLKDLNDIYFLHTLANSPEMIIPPGKSLRSVLSGPRAAAALGDGPNASQSSLPTLQQKVEEIAKQAFWDEARDSLSDPTPGKQVARLKLLHSDLRDKLDGLIGPKHPIMIMLSSPLSPSSNPLLSALRHLQMVTSTLKTLCAPIRDEALESVLALLSDDEKGSEERVVESFKLIFQISDAMKQDMSNILLNSVSDEDLHLELIRQARTREVRAILELWSLESIRSSWTSWTSDSSGLREGDVKWIRQLAVALGSDSPVRCLPPQTEGTVSDSVDGFVPHNEIIPAPFLFTCPSLHRIQNHLQAVTIAATLRTLVPRPIRSVDSIDPDSSFAERILSLLMIEVKEEQDSGTIKIANLADEVVREHQRLLKSSTTANNHAKPSMDDASLRAAVDKLLRPTDPVYALLRKRLLENVIAQISSALRRMQQHAPTAMHTGREAKRLKPDPALTLDLRHDKRDMSLGHLKVDAFHVKGYEEDILSKNILDVTNSICKVVEWIRNGWGDLVALE
ncbi:hypothetical protein SCHPADRAFT_906952 [Schizopora paradoxa]|uniref:Uncharacterized protein n=1 Tax=Schizopora paradoxa TaxID=27342 RepID=A0A0H2RFM6_9AGAM|nr:hypothetical protein SCHPADRAFT_906952 [Schizopora paradoxa]